VIRQAAGAGLHGRRAWLSRARFQAATGAHPTARRWSADMAHTSAREHIQLRMSFVHNRDTWTCQSCQSDLRRQTTHCWTRSHTHLRFTHYKLRLRVRAEGFPEVLCKGGQRPHSCTRNSYAVPPRHAPKSSAKSRSTAFISAAAPRRRSCWARANWRRGCTGTSSPPAAPHWRPRCRPAASRCWPRRQSTTWSASSPSRTARCGTTATSLCVNGPNHNVI